MCIEVCRGCQQDKGFNLKLCSGRDDMLNMAALSFFTIYSSNLPRNLNRGSQ